MNDVCSNDSYTLFLSPFRMFNIQEEPEESLSDWSIDLDLEKYLYKIKSLGIKRVTHLKHINRKHLDDINMLEIEQLRFMEKLVIYQTENC